MNFKRQKRNNYDLLDTAVENIFINKYMASAPGDFVKVYLFGLMYAELGEEMSNEKIAKRLGLREGDVRKAWTYWEDMGIIHKNGIDKEDKSNYQVEFVNLRELRYGKEKKEKKTQVDEQTKALIS